MAQVERRRYIGPYGHKHRPARVEGVGLLYRLEIVEVDREKNEIRFDRAGVPPVPITAEALARLYGDEFESADNFCSHRLASGQYCSEKRVEGSQYCTLHGMLLGVTSNGVPNTNVESVEIHPDTATILLKTIPGIAGETTVHKDLRPFAETQLLHQLQAGAAGPKEDVPTFPPDQDDLWAMSGFDPDEDEEDVPLDGPPPGIAADE